VEALKAANEGGGCVEGGEGGEGEGVQDGGEKRMLFSPIPSLSSVTSQHLLTTFLVRFAGREASDDGEGTGLGGGGGGGGDDGVAGEAPLEGGVGGIWAPAVAVVAESRRRRRQRLPAEAATAFGVCWKAAKDSNLLAGCRIIYGNAGSGAAGHASLIQGMKVSCCCGWQGGQAPMRLIQNATGMRPPKPHHVCPETGHIGG
jgi:hypothetical protein